MRRSGAAALAVGSVLFAGGARPAQAFCRTTTCDLCPPPDTGCVTEGLPLYWASSCVSYDLQGNGSKWATLEVATALVDAAFAAWAGASCDGQPPSISLMNLGPVTCAKREFNDGQHSAGGNANIIVFRDDFWPETSVADPASTLALTTVTFSQKTGQIFDADIEVNGSENPLSTTDAVPPGGYDLASILAHETGHFLGLAHSTAPCVDDDSCPTMNGRYRPGSTAYRTLEPDDQAGLCAIYPPDRAVKSTSCNPIGGFASECGHPPESQGGCATGGYLREADLRGAGSVFVALAGGASAAMARRRRRRVARPRE